MSRAKTPKKQQTATKQKRTKPEGFTHVRSKKGIHEYELNTNGLRVLYMHTRGTQTVTANIVYLIGSRHEARGETGIAHMLEHMMFKPTGESAEKRDKQLGWEELDASGALMNATTWFDRTSYFSSLPTEYFEKMLKVEARRMRHIILEDSEFQPERANVLSEYEMYAGDPMMLQEFAVNGAAYISHPYGHDTLGHKADIQKLTVDKLRKYYDTYYWPNNAYLVVVGDIKKEEALASIKKVFARIKRSPEPIPTVDIEEPEQLGPRRVTVKKESPINLLTLNFKSVPGWHKDWAPLQLLLTHLADDESSVLHKKLVNTEKASAVSPYHLLTYDPFLCGFIIYITKNATHGEVEELVLREIENTKQKPLEAKRLAALKSKVKASELYDRDGGFSIAGALTDFIAMGDWTKYYTLLDEIEKVTTDDITRVAQTYLVENGKTTGTFIGTSK